VFRRPAPDPQETRARGALFRAAGPGDCEKSAVSAGIERRVLESSPNPPQSLGVRSSQIDREYRRKAKSLEWMETGEH